MLLTDELLLNYKRCRRRSFLEVHGDPLQKDPERDFLLKLRQESKIHVGEVLSGQSYHQPNTLGKNWQARANQTQLLMQQGVECIYQGVLLSSDSQDRGLLLEDFLGRASTINFGDVTLVGTPDLLVKQPGTSQFGDWMYLPISIKLGRRPKPEYQIVAAFHAYLLAAIQGVLPETSQIILRRRNSYAVNLDNWLPRLQNLLFECIQMMLLRQEPEVFISRQRCGLCQWHSHCYAIAQSQKHLSLIPGVTPNRYEQLQVLGLKTVESLAAASPTQIDEAFGVEVASQLKQQAQSLLHNRAILKSASASQQKIALPTASIELYFDIEAEPERNLDYLLGILLVNRQEMTKQFYSFLAEKPEDEVKIWQQFLDLVWLYPDAPIFHFSEYEVEAVKRLAKLYKTPPRYIRPVLSRFVDLHQRVTHSVTLPVESYSLKSLANWLGFQWRDRGVSGDQCVCWYDQWLKSGDRALLEIISRYNEDDCRATHHLKDWLVEFLPDA